MTSPNFRPEDVKVGSRILCSDGIVRTVKEFVHDQEWQPVGVLFDDKVVLKWDEMATAILVTEQKTIHFSEGKIVTDVELRLNAIEERLTKLEGSAVKVEYDEPYVPVQIFEEKTLAEVKEMYPGEPQSQSPKVCPVSGMFLEEPEDGQHVYDISHVGEYPECGEYFRTNYQWVDAFEQGQLFATREDAERYAKHLKAMAKLRRLDARESVVFYGDNRFHKMNEIARYYNEEAYNKLTPEEQNALLWPNEEK